MFIQTDEQIQEDKDEQFEAMDYTEEIADLKETIRQLSLSSVYLKVEMLHFRYAFNYVRNKHNLPPCCTNQDHRGEHPPYEKAKR